MTEPVQGEAGTNISVPFPGVQDWLRNPRGSDGGGIDIVETMSSALNFRTVIDGRRVEALKARVEALEEELELTRQQCNYWFRKARKRRNK